MGDAFCLKGHVDVDSHCKMSHLASTCVVVDRLLIGACFSTRVTACKHGALEMEWHLLAFCFETKAPRLLRGGCILVSDVSNLIVFLSLKWCYVNSASFCTSAV